jgi:hypothetical protein
MELACEMFVVGNREKGSGGKEEERVEGKEEGREERNEGRKE